jgi:apolipoprotein D and lipocalin family protein
MQHLLRPALGGVCLLVAACSGGSAPSDLAVVPSVDLQRYMGTWYEIARLPMWFQRGCIRSQAHYELIDSETVAVANSCTTAEGETKQATGRARVVDPASNAKLEVVFDNWFSRIFPSLARGDYWIIDLDPQYRTVVVGHPSRKYLWILARTPEIPEARYQELVALARARGFEVERLVRAGDSS